MLLTKQANFGELIVTIYDFEKAGDVLPTHQHDENTIHISVVARGSFISEGDDWKKKMRTGDIIDWDPYVNHSFTALEDNSRLVNILKKHGGVPNDPLI